MRPDRIDAGRETRFLELSVEEGVRERIAERILEKMG